MRQECGRLLHMFNDADESNLRAGVRNSKVGGSVVDRFDPVIDVSPHFAAIAADPRIVEPASELFGDRALIFKDKLIFKRPGTHGYKAHQDYTYWHELGCPPEFMLSVLLAIDDSHAENGALAIYPGLHRRHFGALDRPDDIFNPERGLCSAADLAGVEPYVISLRAGDVLLFHSLAPHESGINNGTASRRSLFLTYSAAKYGDLYADYYRKFHSYLKKDRQSHPQVHFK
jgi:2-aminoethylphosphonate dioxygenase